MRPKSDHNNGHLRTQDVKLINQDHVNCLISCDIMIKTVTGDNLSTAW